MDLNPHNWRNRGFPRFSHQSEQQAGFNLYQYARNDQRINGIQDNTNELFHSSAREDDGISKRSSFGVNRGRDIFANRFGKGHANFSNLQFTNTSSGSSGEKIDNVYSQSFSPNDNFSETKFQTSQRLMTNSNFRLSTHSKRLKQELPFSSSSSSFAPTLSTPNSSAASLVVASGSKPTKKKPIVTLKPVTFVHRNGTLSNLDSLVNILKPRETSGKFVVNAIVGTSASGKSSTWNEILKQPVFKTRTFFDFDESTDSENCEKNLHLNDDQLTNNSQDANVDKTLLKPEEEYFTAKTNSLEMVLCPRTIGRWFVFDTPPLLCSNPPKTFLSYLIKKPFKESYKENLSKNSISTENSFASTSNSAFHSKTITKEQSRQIKSSNKHQQKISNTNTTNVASNEVSHKNPTLFSLQILTFLFVCSDNVVIILDPSSCLDELFSFLLTAIMIVGRPTSTLYFYIPEKYFSDYSFTNQILNSIQKRLTKHFRSKANFSLVTSCEELSILLDQPKISRFSALIDYNSEQSWINSAHRYWTNIDIPGNLLYQYSSEYDRIILNDDQQNDKEELLSMADKLKVINLNDNRSKSKLKSKSKSNIQSSSKNEILSSEGIILIKNKEKKNSWEKEKEVGGRGGFGRYKGKKF